jgi:hypothetical protein
VKTPELSDERKQEAIDKVNEICKDKIKALSVEGVNHSQGHLYTIGPNHIQNNVLTADEIRRLEALTTNKKAHCYHRGCTASYDEHTHEWGMFLQLLCNMTNDEGNELLKKVVAEVLEPYQIMGITFVESPEHFRFTKT